MTDSVFLRFIARTMMPVLLLFSLFMLFRGHNEPGGGFVGGLIGASSIVLMTLAYGPHEVRKRLRIDFLRGMLWGVLVAISAGLVGLLLGGPFQAAYWLKSVIPGLGELEFGTPILFDIGVYITVFGITSSIVLVMAEEGVARSERARQSHLVEQDGE